MRITFSGKPVSSAQLSACTVIAVQNSNIELPILALLGTIVENHIYTKLRDAGLVYHHSVLARQVLGSLRIILRFKSSPEKFGEVMAFQAKELVRLVLQPFRTQAIKAAKNQNLVRIGFVAGDLQWQMSQRIKHFEQSGSPTPFANIGELLQSIKRADPVKAQSVLRRALCQGRISLGLHV